MESVKSKFFSELSLMHKILLEQWKLLSKEF